VLLLCEIGSHSHASILLQVLAERQQHVEAFDYVSLRVFDHFEVQFA
jgi:hypothetical protein